MRITKQLTTVMSLSYHRSRAFHLLLIGCLALGMLVQAGCDDDTDVVRADPTTPPIPPSAPADLQAASQSGAVALSWSAPNPTPVNPNAISYRVYRSTSSMSDLPDEPIARSVVDLSYTDEDVENGTTYYYRITATSGPEVESGSSNEDAATPFAPPPERP